MIMQEIKELKNKRNDSFTQKNLEEKVVKFE